MIWSNRVTKRNGFHITSEFLVFCILIIGVARFVPSDKLWNSDSVLRLFEC